MADVKWIKITTDMFDNRKLRHLRRLPDGNNIVLIWVMLLTMAGRCNANGMIFLTENIPYTSKMLADELDFEENTVKLALEALERLNMIVTKGNFFSIAGWEEHQNIDGLEKIREQNRIRQAKFKEKQKLLGGNVTDNVTVTQGNAIDIEEDKEKDKNKKKNKDNKDEENLLMVCALLGKHDYSLFEAHTGELQAAILAFIDFRKSIKKPMTEKAVDLLISKLKKLSDSIPEQIEILNQSIINGWQGIFPLKDQTTQKGGNINGFNRNNGRNTEDSKKQEYGVYL